jgi:predicted AAA+ superfamily ATPase
MSKTLFKRSIQEDFAHKLHKGKIIILYGARQVGKTTLVKEILAEQTALGRKGAYFNCELDSVRSVLSVKEAERLRVVFGEHDFVVLDEAQNIPDIGMILKIIHDEIPSLRVIATGSSSFELASKTSEPMTGRHYSFTLFSLSFEELVRFEPQGLLGVQAKLEDVFRFGSYPEVYVEKGEVAKREVLDLLTSDYLYKDVLKFEGIKKAAVIGDLLKLLALQVGQEVSLQSLAGTLGINRLTVQKYIDILEKSFVVTVLRPLSRNEYRSVSRRIKVYFWDLGIRNSLIRNYNAIDVRSDIGALWENFCIVERLKHNAIHHRLVNSYFWRSYSGQEIDYIEESGGRFEAFEFKWSDKKQPKIPTEFSAKYISTIQGIHRENFWKFLGK